MALGSVIAASLYLELQQTFFGRANILYDTRCSQHAKVRA